MKLLRVTGKGLVAGAEWEKDGAGWRCVRAAPIIKWMLRCEAGDIRAELARRSMTWEWLSPHVGCKSE